MTTSDSGLRARFSKRRDPGILWGRTLPQLLCLTAAVLLLVAAVRVGAPRAWWLGGCAATVTLLGFARWRGRALVEQLPAAGIDLLLHATGQADYRGGPYRPHSAGDDQPQLPGPLSRLSIRGYQIDPDRAEIGVLHDNADGTLVAVVQIAGSNMFLQDDRETDAAAVAFGRLLDGLAQGQLPIVAIQALTRVRPDVTDDARRDLRVRGQFGHPFARRINQEALAALAATGLVHESYLAVRIAPHRSRGLLRQFGGGDLGAAALAVHTVARITADLQTAGVHVDGWVSPRGLAGLIRSALDPSSDTMIARRSGGRGDPPGGDPGLPSGVAPRAAEPLIVRRARSYLAHCDSYSRTWWIAELPHADTGAPVGFLTPLLLGLPCRHTLSITLQPVDPRRAQRSIDTQSSTAEARQQLDERIRRRHRRSDQQQAADVSRREADLVDGHATYRLAVTVTVTARSLDELELASAHAESAISNCGMEGQVWYVETDQAYYLAALPIARGLR